MVVLQYVTDERRYISYNIWYMTYRREFYYSIITLQSGLQTEHVYSVRAPGLWTILSEEVRLLILFNHL